MVRSGSCLLLVGGMAWLPSCRQETAWLVDRVELGATTTTNNVGGGGGRWVLIGLLGWNGINISSNLFAILAARGVPRG